MDLCTIPVEFEKLVGDCNWTNRVSEPTAKCGLFFPASIQIFFYLALELSTPYTLYQHWLWRHSTVYHAWLPYIESLSNTLQRVQATHYITKLAYLTDAFPIFPALTLSRKATLSLRGSSRNITMRLYYTYICRNILRYSGSLYLCRCIPRFRVATIACPKMCSAVKGLKSSCTIG